LERKPPVRKGAYFIIDMKVFTEEHWAKKDCRRLNYHASETLSKVIRGLTSFATWAQDFELVTGLRQLEERFSETWPDIYSREKLTVSPRLQLVTYYSRLEFRLQAELADQLQLFLGTYLHLEPASVESEVA
jgi:hypothetical protein